MITVLSFIMLKVKQNYGFFLFCFILDSYFVYGNHLSKHIGLVGVPTDWVHVVVTNGGFEVLMVKILESPTKGKRRHLTEVRS